jgi:hypothetical protein
MWKVNIIKCDSGDCAFLRSINGSCGAAAEPCLPGRDEEDQRKLRRGVSKPHDSWRPLVGNRGMG